MTSFPLVFQEAVSFEKLPAKQLPRERLLEKGPEALSVSELLAIVLSTGIKGKSVFELADEMILRFGGLEGLLDASIPELMEIKGIGKTKAIQLRAIFGIMIKTRRPLFNDHYLIQTPAQAFELAYKELWHQKQEVVMVILRDARGRMIHHERIAMGTLSEVLVHPREVFYPAVRYKAYSLIVAHNHPSGDPTPSSVDLELTRLLVQAGRILAIRLDDHLIIGHESFVSLRERGFLGHSESY